MKIGILGSGDVGRKLAGGFLATGNEVMIGTRDAAKKEVVEFLAANAGAKAGSFEDAAKFGEMVVLAVKGLAGEKALESAKGENLGGKVVIDTTNPIADAPPDNGVLHYFTTLEESLMERYQKKFPEARFVKAFNSVGNAFMFKPDFAQAPTMFICGNDDAAKKEVSGILASFGWEVADMGGVQAARAIEPLCILWCIPGFRGNEWAHAFKLLKK